jgi:hypothetical protein
VKKKTNSIFRCFKFNVSGLSRSKDLERVNKLIQIQFVFSVKKLKKKDFGEIKIIFAKKEQKKHFGRNFKFYLPFKFMQAK